MTSLIQKVVHCARETFRRQKDSFGVLAPVKRGEEFNDSVRELMRLVNLLTAKDLGLDKSEALHSIEANQHQNGGQGSGMVVPPPTCTYIEVFENADVTVGVFIIHRGCKIPLHNHPSMHGIVKCLSGTLHLSSFTQMSKTEIKKLKVPVEYADLLKQDVDRGLIFPVRKEFTNKALNPNSQCSLLSPDVKNFHELSAANEEPAAFIDILAPPYTPDIINSDMDFKDSQRDCSFFIEHFSLPPQKENGLASGDRISYLQCVEAPPDYYCDYEHYRGPYIEK